MEGSRKLDRSRRKLFKATAARCRGATVILGSTESGLGKAVRDRGLDVVETELGAASAFRSLPEESCGTVLVSEVLEHMPEEKMGEVLDRAWRLLRPGGRLVVTVPNEGCVPSPGPAREFDRRGLRRLLKPLGKPRLATDQPFKWLMMYLDKPRLARRRRVNRTRVDRYRVTARLCRGRVLELGCGEGHLARTISDRGLEVVGVDISGEKIRRAREDFPHLTFVESDIRALVMPEEQFDTVVIAEVLEHVLEKAGSEMLEKAWCLLKPGGRLIVSVPNEDLIPHPHHLRQFDRRSLKRLLRPLGNARLVTDQPFKWLQMYVEKGPRRGAPES